MAKAADKRERHSFTLYSRAPIPLSRLCHLLELWHTAAHHRFFLNGYSWPDGCTLQLAFARASSEPRTAPRDWKSVPTPRKDTRSL